MFNLLVGRQLQEMMGQTPQQCFLMPILPGTDGVQKMSKSLGNFVAVEEEPNDMYGKLMSLPDALILAYLEYLTDLPGDELTGAGRDLAEDRVNPMELKKRLAWDVTSQFHDRAAADTAQEHFQRVVQRRDLPEEIPEFSREPAYFEDRGRRLSNLMLDAALASSASEAKRLIGQGAVQLIRESTGETRGIDRDLALAELDRQPRDVLKVGRRRFVRLLND